MTYRLLVALHLLHLRDVLVPVAGDAGEREVAAESLLVMLQADFFTPLMQVKTDIVRAKLFEIELELSGAAEPAPAVGTAVRIDYLLGRAARELAPLAARYEVDAFRDRNCQNSLF